MRYPPHSSPRKASTPIFSLLFYLSILTVLMAGLLLVDLYLPLSTEAKALPTIPARGASVSHFVMSQKLRTVPVQRGTVYVDTDGYVVSSNPVWNMCVRGKPLPVMFVRSNTDAVIHRQGRIRKRIPLSCKDYHKSSESIWRHPDLLDLEVYLNRDGKLLGLLTSGYVIERTVSG